MPQLALAYLALTDDDQAAEQRTLPRMLAAALLTIALAFPLATVVVKGHDHPVATLAGKAGLVFDDD